MTLRIAVKQVGGNPAKATPQKYGVREHTEEMTRRNEENVRGTTGRYLATQIPNYADTRVTVTPQS